ncbi:hypothetical protein BU23DRAFT_125386 [Bimuria novae-zelandiae CBS 107.79]|uniref:Uncharacterized protein n=1 Tax=Bimuria novae-zelandiae CBS 107.79 TaxID=1447943 RepID=A0A6A5VKC2_9PLEO|nr:hypothetical protein BU23DRAFT_125386 [Bimuria novae-zelandiae CBS 107.79]
MVTFNFAAYEPSTLTLCNERVEILVHISPPGRRGLRTRPRGLDKSSRTAQADLLQHLTDTRLATRITHTHPLPISPTAYITMSPNNTTDPTPKPTLPRSATTTFANPSPPVPVLPRSTTTLFTTPFRTATAVPKTFVSTLYLGLKRVAVPVATAVGLRKKPKKSRIGRLMEAVEPYEEIDEWQEIEEGEVREDMRAEREGMGRGHGKGGREEERREERRGK